MALVRARATFIRSGLVSARKANLPSTCHRFQSLHTQTGALNQSNFESKYADKLKQRAQEMGLSVAELQARAKETLAKQRSEAASQASISRLPASSISSSSTSSIKTKPALGGNIRVDSSPVKLLSSIINIPRLFSTPHTPAQISSLWTAYHASRSSGTGKGYICASVPLELYQKMIIVSAKYPVFVVPVLQMKKGEAEVERAHEFYFLQWGFHGAPPTPGIDDPFCTSRAVSSSPQISTILFTPLQEYKIRAAFATPYLVLTFYTDLASSHGIVLMRGEITPGTESEGRHLLNQEDAQLLAMQVQKFYLWGEANDEEKGGEGERLLKEFHEKPQEFKWEELLKRGDLSV